MGFIHRHLNATLIVSAILIRIRLPFMRGVCICSLAIFTLALSGCTEMRVEGDAKVFQSSAVGSIIRTVIGLGLMGLGAVSLVGSVMPDSKPKNRIVTPKDRTSTGQRVGLALFGFSMGFVGLFLAGISLLFPSKLHVTVYPDRVAMASTYSQTGGREVVVPFAGLSSVELRQEPNVVGKLKTFLVFTQKNGGVIKQDAGNNERQAVETIRQALEEYQKSAPAVVENKASSVTPPPQSGPVEVRRPMEIGSVPKSPLSQPKAAPQQEEFALKRYAITSPVPTGYRAVGPNDTIEVGEKLKANFGPSWFFVTVVAVNPDGTITCNWDDWKSYTYKMMREDLIIANHPEGAVQGTTPSSSPPPASSSSPPSASPPQSASQYSFKRYKITIPVPKGYSIVGAETEVRVGSKLQACYAGHWEFVTVVAVNDDGTITCNWNRFKSFTYKMLREDLIIADQDGP